MRRLLAFCLVAAPVLTACVNQDPAPLFADIAYQVRCVDCTPRAMDDSPHMVSALDGDSGYKVACGATRPTKDLAITFSATFIDAKHPSTNHSIKILQADIESKTNPGAGCRVVVSEGSNTYEGKCTSGSPTDDQPCQVKFKPVAQGIVKGTLLCQNIPNNSEATLTRHLVSPGTDKPASFEVDGCTGL
jgi:hypothetical protein